MQPHWITAAIEMVGDGYWQYFFDTQTVYYSPQNLRILGLTDKALLEKDAWRNRVHPDDMMQFALLETAYANHQIEKHEIEYRIRNAKDEYVWLLDRGGVVEKDEKGAPKVLLGFHTVIDAAKLNEQGFRDTSYRLTSLLSNLQSGILVENEHRFINLVNPYFCELFGIPVGPEILTGTDCSNAAEEVKDLFVAPQEFVDRIAQLLEERKPAMGETLRMKNGHVLLRDFIPIWQGEKYMGHLWNYVDITRYVNNEELEIQKAINFFLSSMYEQETIDDLLWDVAKKCIGTLGFVDCVIYLKSDDGKMLEQRAAFGAKSPEEKVIFNRIEIPLGSGIVGSVATTGKAELISDTSQDVRYIADDDIRLSEICVPIILDGRVLGVIDSEHPVKGFFHHKHLQILSAIANLCAIKIDHIQQSIQQKAILDKQRMFYEDILNKIPADIAVFDAQHRYVFLNPKGIADNELRQWMIGKDDFDYCAYRKKPIQIAHSRRQRFDQLRREKKLLSWEEELKQPNGEVRHHLRNMYPVLDAQGQLDYVIGYGLDITDRKLIEQKIDQSQKALGRIIQYSLALILTHDLKGNIKMANPACYQILNQPFTDLSGSQLKNFLHPRDADYFDEHYIPAITVRKSFKGVARVRNKQGQMVYLMFNNYLLLDQGDPLVICFAIDISKRVRMEEDLRIAKRAAEDAAKAKESFLANLSHEIRTPMNGILGLANMMAKTKLTAQQTEYLSVIQDSASHLLKVVNDVLDLEKIAAGKFELEQLPFDIGEKTELTIAAYRFRAEEKGVLLQFTNNLPEGLVVKGDQFKLAQILNNLLSNALKFTEHGTVTVTASLLKTDQQYHHIEFTVADTGVGIESADADRIFEPYVQVAASGEQRSWGTGLGLAICRQLVELQQGKIQATGSMGNGAVFTFSIPYLKAKQHQHIEGPAVLRPTVNAGLHILIAEDVKVNQLVLKFLLQEWGCHYEIVETGEDALRAVQRSKFDLVLMDIQMPKMDGMEATRLIRQLPDAEKSSVPIIALTAFALRGDLEKYLDCGMNDCVTKPFEEEMLEQVISRHTQRTAAQLAAGAAPASPAGGWSADVSKVQRMLKGNPEAMREIVQALLDTMPVTVSQFEEAVANRDAEAARRALHKIKPAIRTFCTGDSLQTLPLLDELLEGKPGWSDLDGTSSQFCLHCRTWLAALHDLMRPQ